MNEWDCEDCGEEFEIGDLRECECGSIICEDCFLKRHYTCHDEEDDI